MTERHFAIQMPPEFPAAAYFAFDDACRAVLPYPSEEITEYLGATNLIHWRFRAALEYKADFVESWRRVGAGFGFEDIYQRERSFFGFFTCGASCIEAAVYACFALCAALPSMRVPFGVPQRRGADASKLIKILTVHKPASALLSSLQVLMASQEWKLWRDYRNAMVHRSDIPRIYRAVIHIGPGEPPPLPPMRMLDFASRWSHDGLQGDEEELDRMVTWLTSMLEEILTNATTLALAG